MADVADCGLRIGARGGAAEQPDDKEVFRTAAAWRFFYVVDTRRKIPLIEQALRHDPYSTWTAAKLAFGLIMSAKDVAGGLSVPGS